MIKGTSSYPPFGKLTQDFLQAHYDSELYYIYHGERPDRGNAGDHIVLIFDANEYLTNRYVYGPAVDQVLADEQVTTTSSPGDIIWPLGDNLQTIRDLAEYNSGTDSTTVSNHRTFDSFGNITAETNAAVDHVFAFTARELDEEIGLHNYRGRILDVATAQFLSEDPISFNGGLNLYAYVGNNPLVHTDPSGNIAVCCRPMQTGSIADKVIYHCQLRNVCVSGETSYPVWIDDDPNRKMDNGMSCAQATNADIEACLRRNPHSDKPRGGSASIGNNCQTGALLRLGKCCLNSNWKPQFVAGDPRGRCLEWHTFFADDRVVKYCVKWEIPDWQRRTVRPCPDPPVCPRIDDESHGGWPGGRRPKAD
jgi:RHS repeat-associated protein